MKLHLLVPLLLSSVASGCVLPDECYRPTITIDFDKFQKGDIVSDIGYGVSVEAVRIVKKSIGSTAPASAMIFDTSNPSGGDFDLGTPNSDFGGPGIGSGGASGSPTENGIALNNVLIISQDEDTTNPNDNANGGTMYFDFVEPKYVESIGLLDNDENSVTIDLFKTDNTTEQIIVTEGGENSYTEVIIDRKLLTGMNVHFVGSGALTHLNLKGRKECGPCVSVYKFCGFKNDPTCMELKEQCECYICSLRMALDPSYECDEDYEPWP